MKDWENLLDNCEKIWFIIVPMSALRIKNRESRISIFYLLSCNPNDIVSNNRNLCI
jgi:hypothetical protein